MTLAFQNLNAATQHMPSLKIQGKLFTRITYAFHKTTTFLRARSSLPGKIFQMQMPTASNMFRWYRDSDMCQLCASVCRPTKTSLITIEDLNRNSWLRSTISLYYSGAKANIRIFKRVVCSHFMIMCKFN